MREVAILLLRISSWMRTNNIPGRQLVWRLHKILDPPEDGLPNTGATLEYARRLFGCPKDIFYQSLEWQLKQRERESLGLPAEPLPERLRWTSKVPVSIIKEGP